MCADEQPRLRGASPSRMTASEFQELGNWFREYLAEKPLIQWSIILAGVGGLVETLHTIWLLIVWLHGRI